MDSSFGKGGGGETIAGSPWRRSPDQPGVPEVVTVRTSQFSPKEYMISALLPPQHGHFQLATFPRGEGDVTTHLE